MGRGNGHVKKGRPGMRELQTSLRRNPNGRGVCISQTWMRRRSHLQGRFAEAQGVGDDGGRAEAHGGAGQHRTEQPTKKRIEDASGDGNPNYVVKKSPGEILLDVANRGAAQLACADNSAQVAFEKGDASVFHGYV